MQILVGLLVLLAAATLGWLALALGVARRCLRHPPRQSVARAITRGEAVEPEDRGASSMCWTLRTRDGLDLPVWTVTGSGDGPPTVVLHDWGGSKVDLLPELARWQQGASIVVLPDLRGHGDAAGWCDFGGREADDLRRLLETLDQPARLIGLGLGGRVAEAVGRSHPDRVIDITVIDPWPDTVDEQLQRLQTLGLPLSVRGPIIRLAARMVGISTQNPTD